MFDAMLLIIINLAATYYMVGIIWMVQLVHYPLMAQVGSENHIEYHARHVKMMGFVVGPVMVVEAFSTVLILGASTGFQFWLSVAGTALILVIWLATAFLSVPCHMKLEKGFDSATHSFLVKTNWVRTISWTVRGVIMNWMLMNAITN